MALDLTPEQKELGKANFHRVVGHHGLDPNRREFMKGLLAAGAVLPVSAAVYFGYSKLSGSPVLAGLIGAGDEGGVLVGEHNPEYLEFLAFSEIRPTNVKRIFEDERTRNPASPRKGFKVKYGNDAAAKIRHYQDYKELLANKDIEAVVIALPLHLHAKVAIEAMRAGKHVLCEKLMAWNIAQCKEMIKVAEQTDRVLSIGHQRHYSLLYAHAVEVLNTGDLGDVRHIRALWHRNNALPRLDKDGKPIIDTKSGLAVLRDSWRPEVADEDRKAVDGRLEGYGYKSAEELVRWRLYNRTGGGLMAELGSHQLDACSIFLGKVHPLAVSGVGGKYFYQDDREVEDHVFCTFEFPGKNYWADAARPQVKDKNDKVIVTYSSINTNGFEPYGECVMGTQGTMVVEQEQTVMLYGATPGAARSTSVTVGKTGSGLTAVDSSGSTGPADTRAGQQGQGALGGAISRGYREEMEHFAYCVKMWNDKSVDKKDRPWVRCHGKVAMADAVIALTSNLAMRGRGGKGPERIEFKNEWFDPKSAEVPDGDLGPGVV
jgi:predicted dehydrogenase